MAALTLEGVHKQFGPVEVLQGIDLEVGDGEFTVFVGPSGCGKSTLLRLICGLDEVSAGTMLIDGMIVNDVPPSRRGVAMVFQSYALYPHMNVEQNMGYALRLARLPRSRIRERVRAAAEILQLTPFLARKPRQLSGGQRQRVAIGRAIVREPRIFLFDEPLSNLDAALRVEMRLEIAKLKERLGTTMIYVTHDQVEAMTLADKIVVMNAGRIEQVGAPLTLYRQPVNRFVAGFIGSPRMNFMAVEGTERRGGELRLRLPGGFAIDLPAGASGQVPVELGIRPEHLAIVRAGEPGTLAGRVGITEHLGSDTFAFVELGDPAPPLLVRVPGEAGLRRGERVGLAFDSAQVHLFDEFGLAIGSNALGAARSAA